MRTNSSIHGIKIGLEEHRISLYADDVLLYLKLPDTSTDVILTVIEKYSNFSGYNINLDKSQALYMHAPSEAISKSPFHLALSGFQYLGINITPNLEDLFKANYPPLITKINQNLSDWSILPNSFFGRINVIRMNILQRLNFLFQNLPCYLNTNFFKRINSLISRYIWNHKKPRLKLSLLMKPKELGGVSLPNLQLYFWAAQIKHVKLVYLQI